jgi:hypothetical protein
MLINPFSTIFGLLLGFDRTLVLWAFNRIMVLSFGQDTVLGSVAHLRSNTQDHIRPNSRADLGIAHSHMQSRPLNSSQLEQGRSPATE